VLRIVEKGECVTFKGTRRIRGNNNDEDLLLLHAKNTDRVRFERTVQKQFRLDGHVLRGIRTTGQRHDGGDRRRRLARGRPTIVVRRRRRRPLVRRPNNNVLRR